MSVFLGVVDKPTQLNLFFLNGAFGIVAGNNAGTSGRLES